MAITIESDNRCWLCNKHLATFNFKYKRTLTKGLKEVDIEIYCDRCKQVMNSLLKTKKKLLDIQFKIFGLQHTDFFD